MEAINGAHGISAEMLNIMVRTVRIVANGNSPAGTGTGFTKNDWTIDLLHSEGAIRLQMIPASVNSSLSIGQLTITSDSYIGVSTRAVKHWEFAAEVGLRVGSVLNLIRYRNRDQYYILEGCIGGRHWIRTVITDLTFHQCMSRKSRNGEVIESLIGFNYSIGQPPQPLQVLEGVFLTPGYLKRFQLLLGDKIFKPC